MLEALLAAEEPKPDFTFKSPALLSNWLIGFLVLGIVVSIVSVVSNWMQLEFLWKLQSGDYDQSSLMTLATQNDDRQSIVTSAYAIPILGNIILFCFWINLVARNTRAMGAENMKISPRWAVGWFFIPVASLYMPYRAMKEIWCASKAPKAWETVERGSILPWWWALFLIVSVVGKIEIRFAITAKTVPELIRSTHVSIVSDFIYLIACLTVIALVWQIREFQSNPDKQISDAAEHAPKLTDKLAVRKFLAGDAPEATSRQTDQP